MLAPACFKDKQVTTCLAQAHPDAAAPREGPSVPWTAGLVDVQYEADALDALTVSLSGCPAAPSIQTLVFTMLL